MEKKIHTILYLIQFKKKKMAYSIIYYFIASTTIKYFQQYTSDKYDILVIRRKKVIFAV